MSKKRLPALTAREVIRALKRAGFYERRQTGSHVIMRKDGLLRPVPVPLHLGDLSRDLVFDIIKQAHLTVEEFIALL